MKVAYVDTSAIVAIAFMERGGADLARRLNDIPHLLASNLLEAELRAAFAREEQPFAADLTACIEWVLPDRPLGPEIATVLDTGYLRGADLWHVATALYVAGDPAEISFMTVDARQAAVAGALGFQV